MTLTSQRRNIGVGDRGSGHCAPPPPHKKTTTFEQKHTHTHKAYRVMYRHEFGTNFEAGNIRFHKYILFICMIHKFGGNYVMTLTFATEIT